MSKPLTTSPSSIDRAALGTDGSPSPWTHVLTPEQLAARHALTASLDAAFAERERRWYEARTESELRCLMHWAVNTAEDGAYQLARTYLALTFHTVEPVQPFTS